MESTDVTARWQAEMAEFFDVGRPDHAMQVLPEVFNLDAQLEQTQP
jgi:L-rhamnose mutarotase